MLLKRTVFIPLLFLSAAAPPEAAKEEQIKKVESCLPPPVVIRGAPPQCRTLHDRMAELHIPGVSIAVVHGGQMEWARGYGVKEVGGAAVTPDTLFQAGSISKPVAALGALRLVQEHKLALDSDVNSLLSNWKIPASSAVPGAVVTLRELLTHTAGFTVHGFPGYAANAPVPALTQVLNGEKPANTKAIQLESVPGSKWNYSGGGFTVMQQLVIDVTKKPFATFLQDTVLSPIGMTHSTYQQPLPSERLPAAAMPYKENGVAVEGGPHTYPELAAAGLWTTPSDIAKYTIEIRRSIDGHANHVLSPEITKQMLMRGKGNWGLGVQVGGAESDPYFTHGGVNEGYESLFVAYQNHGDGAVVMTNARGGSRLAAEVMSSIALAYGWPDFKPAVRAEIKIDRAVLSRYVGKYEFTPNFSINVTLDGDQLMTQATNQGAIPVFPESETKFFLKVVDAQLEFSADETRKINTVLLKQGGQEAKGKRVH